MVDTKLGYTFIFKKAMHLFAYKEHVILNTCLLEPQVCANLEREISRTRGERSQVNSSAGLTMHGCGEHLLLYYVVVEM